MAQHQFSEIELSDGTIAKARLIGEYGGPDGLEMEYETGERFVLHTSCSGKVSAIPLKHGIPDFASLGLGEEDNG